MKTYEVITPDGGVFNIAAESMLFKENMIWFFVNTHVTAVVNPAKILLIEVTND